MNRKQRIWQEEWRALCELGGPSPGATYAAARMIAEARAALAELQDASRALAESCRILMTYGAEAQVSVLVDPPEFRSLDELDSPLHVRDESVLRDRIPRQVQRVREALGE